MRRGEPQRDSQTLRLRVRRNYCWDEKTEKGEKNPRLCRVGWHAAIGEAGEGHRRQNARAPLGSGHGVRAVCEQSAAWRILS